MQKKLPTKPKTGLTKAAASQTIEASFAEVVDLIEQARQQASRAVNTQLIDLYWKVGEYLTMRISEDGWGKGTVVALAAYIQRRQPGLRGFSPQNLWRMRQFFETYQGDPKLSALLRELPWSSNLHILSKTKLPEEREFYQLAESAIGDDGIETPPAAKDQQQP